jgi:hypothetical protein
VESRRVTRLGWIGLGLSVLFVALAVATGWLFAQDSSCGDGHEMSSVAFLWPWSFLAALLDFFAGVVISIVAGGRGLGNHVVGVIGGLILLTSPVIAVAILNLPIFGL